jgi:hypothetical protein
MPKPERQAGLLHVLQAEHREHFANVKHSDSLLSE